MARFLSLAKGHAQAALATLTAGAAGVGEQAAAGGFMRTASLRNDLPAVCSAINGNRGAVAHNDGGHLHFKTPWQ
jgi:hypothetical protein